MSLPWTRRLSKVATKRRQHLADSATPHCIPLADREGVGGCPGAHSEVPTAPGRVFISPFLAELTHSDSKVCEYCVALYSSENNLKAASGDGRLEGIKTGSACHKHIRLGVAEVGARPAFPAPSLNSPL